MRTLDLALDPRNSQGRNTDDLSDIATTIAADGVRISLLIVDRAAYLATHPDQEPNLEPGTHVVIDGNRRLRAARKNGVADVPVNLDNSCVTDGRDSRIRIIANQQRKNLSPVQEAQEFDRILREEAARGTTVRSLALELGCDHGHISKRRKLLKLPEPIRNAIVVGYPDSGQITVRDATLLVDLDDPTDQLAAFEQIVTGRRKARDVVATIHDQRSHTQAAPPDTDDLLTRTLTARDAICVQVLQDPPSQDEQLRTIAAHTVRSGAAPGPALELAHQWLRAGRIGPDIAAPAQYAAAAIQSPRYLVILAFAIAVAADELHARNPRRERWDMRAVDHYRRLVDAGYQPTEWDAAHLTG